ncbi:hypothetical protein [Bacteroides reticulotermitis]|uniref:hypothetical protein n=1 Tax=Bacteroides reticulotermitis TaxID=1133319 RepID=UPI003A848936
MSLIKHKSDENLESAKILNNNKKFASSVHCSYYSILQLMKYALCEKCSIDYDKQNEKREQDSHLYIRDQLLFQLRDTRIKESIKRKFDATKALRRKADYLNENISDIESLDAYDHAEELIKKIKKEFAL